MFGGGRNFMVGNQKLPGCTVGGWQAIIFSDASRNHKVGARIEPACRLKELEAE